MTKPSRKEEEPSRLGVEHDRTRIGRGNLLDAGRDHVSLRPRVDEGDGIGTHRRADVVDPTKQIVGMRMFVVRCPDWADIRPAPGDFEGAYLECQQLEEFGCRHKNVVVEDLNFGIVVQLIVGLPSSNDT